MGTLSAGLNSDILITDKQGNIVLYSDNSVGIDKNTAISEEFVKLAMVDTIAYRNSFCHKQRLSLYGVCCYYRKNILFGRNSNICFDLQFCRSILLSAYKAACTNGKGGEGFR